MNQPSNLILHQPFTRTYQCATAFISVAKDREKVKNPLGLAVVRLIGNYFHIIEIVKMVALPLERGRVFQYLLSWWEQVPFDYFSIDKENYFLLNGDRKWNEVLSAYKQDHHITVEGVRYPSIHTVIRNADPVTRQVDTLNELINDDGRIVSAGSANLNIDRAVISKADQPDLDALAGAVEQILKIQRRVLAAVADEQARMKAANGRSIY